MSIFLEMEGEKVFALKFAKDCPCGKPDCPVRGVLGDYAERVAAYEGLEKLAAEQIKQLKDFFEKVDSDEPPPLIDFAALKKEQAANEEKRKELDKEDLLPSYGEAQELRKRGSEKYVARAMRRAMRKGLKSVQVRKERVQMVLHARLKQEGFTVVDGSDWITIHWG